MEFLMMTRAGRFPPPHTIFNEEQEEETSDEDDMPPVASPSIIPEPAATMPPQEQEERSDSGFAEGSQQHAQNGMNMRNVIIVDTQIDDDNLSTIYTNNTNTTTTTTTNTYSDSSSITDPEPPHPRSLKCFQNVHRFIKSKPLQRLSHDIELWKWERSQKKSIAYQEELQKKAIEKEQAAHVNFDKNQARTAKQHVKDMRKREREGNVRYRGSWGKREAVVDWFWWVGIGRRKVKGEKREWEAGVTWEELKERHRMLREGDGTLTTWVRTSEEVAAEDGRRSEHARD